MAKLFITEFGIAGLSEDQQASQVKVMPPLAEQNVAIAAASAQSAAFNAATKLIRVHTDVVCSIQIGAAPVATANTMRLAANSTEYFQVAAGDKIAVITNT
jgi:hypothetical protein